MMVLLRRPISIHKGDVAHSSVSFCRRLHKGCSVVSNAGDIMVKAYLCETIANNLPHHLHINLLLVSCLSVCPSVCLYVFISVYQVSQ